MADRPDDLRELDARALRAIAHPLRLRMLAILRAEGPATASQLAERLGESSGLTSYHLRQLAASEFIEEDTARGTRRERWWRPKHRGMTLRTRDVRDDPRPATHEAMELYLQEVVAYQFRSVQDAVLNRHLWSEDWEDALVLNDYPLRLTAQQLRELVAEVGETVERYRKQGPADGSGERVVVILDAFPQHSLPYGGEAEAGEA